ncbi:hypothetical protein [Peterkaempfera sp. SMS 1(5)a]|uniref:hypothetical protein n=1 Tax=Peterkaempfera podocarpi TaxID=3232308 RepID=UPI00366C100B
MDGQHTSRPTALGARRKPAAPKPIVYTVEAMTAIGGNRWTKAGKDRIYLGWAEFAGLEVSRYNSGRATFRLLRTRILTHP